MLYRVSYITSRSIVATFTICFNVVESVSWGGHIVCMVSMLRTFGFVRGEGTNRLSLSGFENEEVFQFYCIGVGVDRSQSASEAI